MDYYILSPLLFILRIAEAFSQINLVLSLSDSKSSIKKIFVTSILLSVLFEIIKMVLPQYLTSIIPAVILILIFIFILKINYKRAIVASLIMGLTVAIVDCMVALSLTQIFNLSTFSELSQIENLMILGRTIIALIIFLLSLITQRIIHTEENARSEDIKNATSLTTIIITFLLLIPNLVMILYYHDNKELPLYVIVINIVAIIAMFFINIFNTKRGIKLVQAEEALINERIHSKTQVELIDSLRTFKHDYGNLLQTMHGYIYTKDMEGLTEYFEQVLAESKIITALDVLNPELFDNPSLYGLITAKFEYARKNRVTMNLEMYTKLNNLDIKSYDFTRILGILLDNAIEAAIGSEKKLVNFYVTERNNKVTIELSNTFSNTGLKIEDMDKKGVSSKGENRGLGLYKVKDILDRYPKIIRERKMTNDIFLQKLIIDKVKLPVS